MTFAVFNTPVPSNVIIPWFDTIDRIPNGWVLCDGNNGTPDFTDKFIRSVPDTATDPGTTGGTASYTMSTSQLPSHSHNGSTSNTGSHTHKWDESSSNADLDLGSDNCYHRANTNNSTMYSTQQGSHAHNANANSTGGNSSIDNIPKHTETLFIQKL